MRGLFPEPVARKAQRWRKGDDQFPDHRDPPQCSFAGDRQRLFVGHLLDPGADIGNPRGTHGPWSGLFLARGALLVPCVGLLVAGYGGPLDRRQLLGALAIGFAIAFYLIALSYSDVIRVILLFYLAPVWSTVIPRSPSNLTILRL